MILRELSTFYPQATLKLVLFDYHSSALTLYRHDAAGASFPILEHTKYLQDVGASEAKIRDAGPCSRARLRGLQTRGIIVEKSVG